jgi:Zn-dependent protease with chaperone function
MSDAIATRMPRVCSVRRSWRLPVALVAAVVVAEAAVFVMRPRDRGPEPVPVEARAYFSEAQIEKAEGFRSGQLWIYVAQTALGLGVLALIVRRPPERLATIKRPVLAGAAVAAAISVATGVAALPLSGVARELQHVGEVYEMDASRRTTAANAYVNGLGRTKRVVLYDTLIEDFTPAETRMVVAHELGHVHYHDMRNGLIWLAIVAPFGMWATAVLAERLAPRGAGLGPRAVPAVALSIAIVVPVLTMVSNQLSRDVERRADAFSLQLTQDPQTLIEFQRRIAIKNVSDPDPPALSRFLLGTHPTTLERLGMAEAFRR